MPEAAASNVCTCPACSERFRVTEDQLQAAAGRVRCGACLTVFDGKAHRSAATTGAAPADAARRTLPSSDDAAQEPATAPSSATAAPVRPHHAGAAWPVLGSIAAALLLVVNIGALQWQSWSRLPALRDVYRFGCEMLGCELSQMRSLAAIAVRSRGSGQRQGPALVLHAELVNRAAFRQPFPALAVTFRADNGEMLAEHRIEPARYLGEAPAQLMVPQLAVPIVLRVTAPSARAANYSLALLAAP